MSRTKRLIPSPAMSVALIALFVALSGSAYAGVQLSKNSVTTKSIKNGAVTGAKVKKKTITGGNLKNNTITSTQINEAKLKTVPEAAKLTGFDPNTKVDKSHLIQFNVASNRGDAPKALAEFGPWKITGRCEVSGANTSAYVDVTNSKDGTYTSGEYDNTPVGTHNWFSVTNFAPNSESYTSGSLYFLDPETGISAFDPDGEPVGIWYGFPGADCRFVGNIPVTTP